MADNNNENNLEMAIPTGQYAETDADESLSSYEEDSKHIIKSSSMKDLNHTPSTESTTSVSESIMHYRELHGRNFRTTEYWGPNDEKQNEELDIGYHMLTLLLDGKLFLAPINPNPQKAIDICTGTGIWAIDFADAYPSAEVIGTGLSLIKPSFTPPNCKFELDDAQMEWTYPRASFDYIHLRCLMGSISSWPSLYAQAFECTKPGGWIEQLEFSIGFRCNDGSIDEGHALSRRGKLVHQASEILGRTFKIQSFSKDRGLAYVCNLAKQYLIDAGFKDITEIKYKLPIGRWSSNPKMKELGAWSLLYLLEGLEGMMLYMLSSVLKSEYIEIQAYLGQYGQLFWTAKFIVTQ